MSDYFLNERLMEQRVQAEQHSAELRRLAREARGAHPGWAARQRCQLSCRLGRLLVSLGRRLLEDGLPRALPSRSAGME